MAMTAATVDVPTIFQDLFNHFRDYLLVKSKYKLKAIAYFIIFSRIVIRWNGEEESDEGYQRKIDDVK